MKYQEEFFHNQIESIHRITEAKEEEFEKLLQEERAKARRFDVDSGTTEDRRLRWVTNSQLDGALCHSFYWSYGEYSEASFGDGNAASQCITFGDCFCFLL